MQNKKQKTKNNCLKDNWNIKAPFPCQMHVLCFVLKVLVSYITKMGKKQKCIYGNVSYQLYKLGCAYNRMCWTKNTFSDVSSVKTMLKPLPERHSDQTTFSPVNMDVSCVDVLSACPLY